MTPELLVVLIVPFISGLASLGIAVMSARLERQKDLARIRIDAYKRFEEAIAEWAKNKNRNTTADVYNACNVIYFVGSKETQSLVGNVASFITPHGLCKPEEDFINARSRALASMQHDIQNTKCKKSRSVY